MASLLYFLPMLIALWSIFVAKTGQLFPKQHQLRTKRKAKAISSERVEAIEDAQGVSDGPGKELALPEDPVPVYELYGHPAPPIPLLGSALPQAPIGYGWEIVTLLNPNNDPVLRLSLLDLKTAKEMDAIEADLTVVRRWRYAKPDTYAMYYRRAEQICRGEVTGWLNRGHGREPVYGKDPNELKGKVMMANLITPLVDWASMLALKFIVEHPDETKFNYMLVEAEGNAVKETVHV